MSDRHQGYIVVLEKSLKDEDSEIVIQTLSMIKGVIDVSPIVDDIQSSCSRSRIVNELSKKIWMALTDETM